MRLVPLDAAFRRALAQCPAFSELPEEARDAIWERFEQREYEPGEALIRQGDLGDSLMLLVGGSAAGFLNRGDERLRIAEFHSGDVVGEMALITREKRSADVVADEPTAVLALKVDDFRDVAFDHPALGMVLTRLIAERLGEADLDGLGGKRIDRYRITRSVGRGGMAVVYEAYDDETEQRVALKMMSHRLTYEEGATARFQREADILLGLSHENIAKVYRRFSALRTNFIAMEFCDGEELASLVARGEPVPEQRARLLLGQLASGLAYLHRSGVIHRDLKPSNVMITREDRVKLTDFGLAKVGTPEGQLPLTTAQTLIGTPLYMAPELLAGRPADELTDLYAFGCLAYELVSGALLFRSKTLFELQEEKQRLTVPPAAAIGRGVSAELRDVLATALRADREERALDLAAVASWAE